MMDKTLIPSSWTTPMDNQMNYTELDWPYQRGATLWRNCAAASAVEYNNIIWFINWLDDVKWL